MAEPQDTGLFDGWITDRIYFQVVPPRTGSTGEFESWITDRIYYRDYVEAELVPPEPPVVPPARRHARVRRRDSGIDLIPPPIKEPWIHPWEEEDEEIILIAR